jgi:hypothetical protein
LAHPATVGEALTVAPNADAPPEAEAPLAMTWTAGRVLAVVAMLAMATFWAAIFAGVFRAENPDLLDDRAFVARTATRCDALLADLEDLPNAAFIDDAATRAEVLDEATDLVEAMIDAIEADAPTEGDDGRSVRGWLADWRTYVENRRDYARRLGEDPDARLYLDESLGGDSVDRPIEVFADVNDMPQCATPGDVG